MPDFVEGYVCGVSDWVSVDASRYGWKCLGVSVKGDLLERNYTYDMLEGILSGQFQTSPVA